jgi:hypothetical protein
MPTKKKTEKKGKPKTPKKCRQPIPAETIDRLIDIFSVPTKSAPNDITADLWIAVADMKGWMMKTQGNPEVSNLFKISVWHNIRKRLDEAVSENDIASVDILAKAWLCWQIEETIPRQKKKPPSGSQNPWKREEEAIAQRLAESIENLIPGMPQNPPNSERKVQFLNTIHCLQNEFKREGVERAPTRAEIALSLAGQDVSKEFEKVRSKSEREARAHQIKAKVTEMAKEMGLDKLLSRERNSSLRNLAEGN